VVVGRDPVRVNDALSEVEADAGGSRPGLGLALDVSSEPDMQEMASAVIERFGRLDILVCSAGIDARPAAARGIPSPIAQLDEALWREVIDTNVRGVFLAVRAALPAMVERRRGDVAVVGSAHAGLQGQPLAGVYSASKFAVAAMAEAVADEVRRHGVRLQLVAPGLVDTRLAAADALHAQFGPPLSPERVGELIAQLVALPDDVTLGASRRDGLTLVRHVGVDGGVASGGQRRRRHGSAQVPVAGSVAVVTGAASGIGRATALALADAGAALVLVDRSRETLEEVAGAIKRGGGEALAATVDVRRAAELADVVDRALERFGRIDTLIASAGVLRSPGCPPKPMASMSLPEWAEVIGVNLTGAFLCNRAVLRPMLAQRSGQIINIASTSGRVGRALDSAYSASKAGVLGLTESLRAEVARYGLRVAAVVPDGVDTPLWRQNGPIPRPKEILPVERIAQTLLGLLRLPDDMLLVDPVVAPFRGRRSAWPGADG
jgi:3-oxoacyl-[acyl-carrier protein] reductase